MTESQKVTAISKLLKRRFPNLEFLDSIDLAIKIIKLIENKNEN